MTEEIKEILESLQYNDHIGTNDKRKLRDYITNLQQENENNIKMLNDIIKEQDMKLTNLQQENESLKKDRKYLLQYYNEDYKSRIEKAVEYIKKRRINTNSWCKTFRDGLILFNDNVDKLLDILRGENNE